MPWCGFLLFPWPRFRGSSKTSTNFSLRIIQQTWSYTKAGPKLDPSNQKDQVTIEFVKMLQWDFIFWSWNSAALNVAFILHDFIGDCKCNMDKAVTAYGITYGNCNTKGWYRHGPICYVLPDHNNCHDLVLPPYSRYPEGFSWEACEPDGKGKLNIWMFYGIPWEIRLWI